MKQAKLTFINGDTLILDEGDMILSTKIYPEVDSEHDKFTSSNKPFEIVDHIHEGIIRSIYEMLADSYYFFVNDDFEIAFTSKHVVKVEIAR